MLKARCGGLETAAGRLRPWFTWNDPLPITRWGDAPAEMVRGGRLLLVVLALVGWAVSAYYKRQWWKPGKEEPKHLG